MKNWNRREVLAAGTAFGVLPALAPGYQQTMLTKPIPATNERFPIIGLGTCDVFDVNNTADAIATRKDIVDQLVAADGSLLDTSPMYNCSEKVIGDIVDAGVAREKLFLAARVWIDGQEAGAEQMQRSADLMNAVVIDLMQVHNLRDTAVHMATIRDWQDEGRIRYNGLTHYTAVTCVIPATSKPHHMADNLRAGFGNMPDAAMRRRMADFFAGL